MDLLLTQLLREGRELLVGDPMDAIDGAGIDRLLDPLGAVAVLAEGPGASPLRLHHEGVGGNVGAVAAADANGLIDPHRLLSKCATQNGFLAGHRLPLERIDPKGEGGIGSAHGGFSCPSD